MMFSIAAIGGIIGGIYGMVHDSFTYAISSEYFLHLKFHQFSWADIGLPPALFAAQIGFIAGGAVGFLSGWFIARTVVPRTPSSAVLKKCFKGILIVFCFAFLAAAVGYDLGSWHSDDDSYWNDLGETLGIIRIPDFVQVAYIHYASYIGGFLGLVTVILRLHRQISNKSEADNGEDTSGGERSS